mmetsp:Transcript_35310/g.85465  ORF Transcript_35310/g.85465 Transcript_35310/m.85465 type:complete len:82 (-) Transcript_35310:933-1178(-)
MRPNTFAKKKNVEINRVMGIYYYDKIEQKILDNAYTARSKLVYNKKSEIGWAYLLCLVYSASFPFTSTTRSIIGYLYNPTQ